MMIQELADLALDALHRDEPGAARRIEDLLDVLEGNPQDQRVRQHRLRAGLGPLTSAVWGFRVRGGSEDFWVFWRFLDEAAGEVSVDYIGPRGTSR
jgi:hypothetical protein